jgi:hypothetical protein|tara:strand:+ start:370 stop:561 length:192 start_codon:yes stop_codon:yes gene_type:complete
MARPETTDEDKQMMAEWLAKGNEIEVCPPGMRSDPENIGYSWGKKKKVAEPVVTPKEVDKPTE